MTVALATALASHGLLLRGGLHPEPGEAGLEETGTVLLVGNAGPAMWDAFAPHIDDAPDPLNRWTVQVIEPIATEFGARALFPFGEPYWPFQRWAKRAERLFQSPLGLLIHPEYGLWHAYRAALVFSERLPVPTPGKASDPCASCTEKPCLSACPAGAFSSSGYDVAACAAHLCGPSAICGKSDCSARSACPIGQGWRYPEPQIRFHMRAYRRSLSGVVASPPPKSSPAA